MSTVIALRVDGDDDSMLPTFCEADGGAYFVVHEIADSGSHYHAVLHSTRDLQAVRMAFRRMFPELRGNQAYSISVVKDLNKYQRYLCKGVSRDLAPEVVGAYGINYGSLEWQDEQHAAYWDNNDDLLRSRSRLSVVDAVVEACRADAISWNDREKIGEIYIRELVSRSKAINIFSVRASLNLVQVQLCPTDDAIKDLARQVCQY